MDDVENKPVSSFVVFLDKIFNGIPPFVCGRQVVGPSSLLVVFAQSNQRLAKRADKMLILLDLSPKIKDFAHTKK